jgi:hypothetical protein
VLSLERWQTSCMPSEGVWVLAGVVASGAVTIATERLRYRWQQEARREEQHERSWQTVAEARREAYSRYLVVQHAVDVLLKAVPRSERQTLAEALQEHYASRRSPPDSSVWAESGAAEMHARLLASDRVLSAIDDFEDWIRKVLAATLMGEHEGQSRMSAQEWDAAWEQQRRILIEAMRQEQNAHLAGRGGTS